MKLRRYILILEIFSLGVIVLLWLYLNGRTDDEVNVNTKTRLEQTVDMIQAMEQLALNNSSAAKSLNVQQKYIKTFKEQILKHERRSKDIRERCAKVSTHFQPTMTSSDIAWRYAPMKINYCEVPKVGCTFWKRILRFLAGEYSKYVTVTKPSDIDRNHVHYMPVRHGNLTTYSLNTTNIAKLRKSRESAFFFTREPYSRLWSAYIDKYVLPDFWSSTITKRLLLQQRGIPLSKNKTTVYCGSDINFDEFLSFISSGQKASGNSHWTPVHQLCYPCDVHYEVVGHFEDFRHDSDFILQLYGLTHLMENTTYTEHVQLELETLSKYNFNIGLRRRKKFNDTECYTEDLIARRLWLAFQMNGYIDRYANFPEALLAHSNKTLGIAGAFIKQVKETRATQSVPLHKLKEQKYHMFIDAYKKVPPKTLQATQKHFKDDFFLFGYDEHPKSIFP